MKQVLMENVNVRFGAVQALKGAHMSLQQGETLMLAGPNGSGKSTLMKVLIGLVRPDTATLQIDGHKRTVDRALKSGLGYLPEAVAFSENLTGRQVLRFFARARSVRKERVDAVLARVGLLSAAERRVRGYSRGMRQRLGLAVAILAEPELLILDEPTGGLDQEGLSVLWSVLAEWHAKERMVLVATHDLALLERRVDRMCVLRAGQTVATDTPRNLRKAVDLPQHVTLELAQDAEDQVSELLQSVERWGRCQIVHSNGALEADMPANALLELMDIRGQFPKAVTALRVEEPSLDVVYEHLLGANA